MTIGTTTTMAEIFDGTLEECGIAPKDKPAAVSHLRLVVAPAVDGMTHEAEVILEESPKATLSLAERVGLGAAAQALLATSERHPELVPSVASLDDPNVISVQLTSEGVAELQTVIPAEQTAFVAA